MCSYNFLHPAAIARNYVNYVCGGDAAYVKVSQTLPSYCLNKIKNVEQSRFLNKIFHLSHIPFL